MISLLIEFKQIQDAGAGLRNPRSGASLDNASKKFSPPRTQQPKIWI
jgi:hypothetical protein